MMAPALAKLATAVKLALWILTSAQQMTAKMESALMVSQPTHATVKELGTMEACATFQLTNASVKMKPTVLKSLFLPTWYPQSGGSVRTVTKGAQLAASVSQDLKVCGVRATALMGNGAKIVHTIVRAQRRESATLSQGNAVATKASRVRHAALLPLPPIAKPSLWVFASQWYCSQS
jgi:hypothetical protein